MRRAAAFAFLAVGLASWPALAWADESDSSSVAPPWFRNDHPLYLTLMANTVPDRPTTMAPRRSAWSLTYADANTIADQNNLAVTDRIIVDAELQRVELGWRYGVSDRLEVSAALPYLVLGGGYMDDFIESFDDLFDATPRARSIRGQDEFRYLFRRGGQNLIDETDESRHGLGDIPLQVKYRFREDARAAWFPTASVRGMLKLPTATDSLLGNDRVDAGIGLLAEQPLGSRLRATTNLDLTTVHLPLALKSIDMDPVMVTGMLAVEHQVTRKASWWVQYTAASNPYPTFDNDMTALNRLPMGIALGWMYRVTPKARVMLAAGENINSAWPDFSWTASVDSVF